MGNESHRAKLREIKMIFLKTFILFFFLVSFIIFYSNTQPCNAMLLPIGPLNIIIKKQNKEPLPSGHWYSRKVSKAS
jgi:hypothetical protein